MESQYMSFRKYLFNEATFAGIIISVVLFVVSPTYELRSAIKSINDKLDSLQTYQLDTMKKDIDTLEDRITDLEKTAISNQTRISNLETELKLQ